MAKNEITLTHPNYRPDIDGLRGVAILLVVGFHFFESRIKGGFIGVDIFFVISGYLISTIIFTDLKKKTFSFIGFYSRRIRRIFPSLLIVLLACYIFGWCVLWPDEYKELGKHIAGGAGFISNILLWQESGYFDRASYAKPLLHLWSLGIEEQFYITFPFLVWLAYTIRLNLLLVLMCVILPSFVLNVIQVHIDPVAAFYSPIFRIWELILGSLLAYVEIFKQNVFAKNKTYIRPDIQSILGFILIAFALRIVTKYCPYPGWLALLPTLGTVMIILAGQQALINRILLSNKIMVWVGLISYPLYLWHYPIYSFSRIIEGTLPSSKLRVALILASVFLAWICYKYIEVPLRKAKLNKSIITTLCLTIMVIGFIGFITYKADGLPFRVNSPLYSINQHQLDWDEKTTKECISLVGLGPETKTESDVFCTYFGPKENIKLAILGDSTANALMPGLNKLLKNKNIGVIDIGDGGCPPFRGIERNNDNGICYRINYKAYDYVLKNPSIKTVILGSGNWYVQTMLMKGLKDSASIGDVFSAFSSIVQKNLSALTKAGKNIVVTFDSPSWDAEPEDCMDRPLFKIPKPNCQRLETEFPGRQAYIDYWRDLFKNDANVCVFYQSRGLKSGDYFNMLDKNEILLYRDGTHLSYNGSEKVVAALMGSKCAQFL